MAYSASIPRDQPFDYALLVDRLRDYATPRDKITRMMRLGEIVRVKKGLYVPGYAIASKEVDPLVLSGLVYGPSYVSFEKALEIHGLIPEHVSEITCATTKRLKTFETPAGRFTYRPVPRAAFPLGVETREANGGHFWLATPEKALCDRIALAPGVSRQSDVPAWLFEDLRVEESSLTNLSLEEVETIARHYRRQPVAILARWLARRS